MKKRTGKKSDLLKLQTDFFNHLYDKDKIRIIDKLNYSRVEALSRLNIYRNNVFGNFSSFLSSIFEITKKKLGDKKFSLLCEEYSKKYFSKSGSLDDYGDFFCEFIKSKKLKEKYIYDLSKLELMYHKAYFLNNYKKEFPVEKFKKITADKLQNLTFTLHPSCSLIESDFAIYAIFNERKNSNKKEYILVENASRSVTLNKLSKEEFMFLSLVNKGLKLYAIYKEICKKNKKEFDIGLLLHRFIQNRIIVDFQIKK